MTDPGAQRFARQRALAGFGVAAQERLAASRVVVVGAGGLGCAVLPVLAAAGVGSIRIVDDDTVDAANLHRQTLFGVGDVGAGKAAIAATALERIAPDAEILAVPARLAEDTAPGILDGADLLVDAGDTIATRRLADALAATAGIPLVWGAALGWVGQVGVAWVERGVSYRDLYPEEPSADVGEDRCATVGVLPSICTVIGGLMASEVLKMLAGVGEPLLGRVLVYDARAGSLREVAYRRDPARPTVAHAAAPTASGPASAVGPDELARLLAASETGTPLLLDVRETDEVAMAALPGAHHIPLGELRDRVVELDPNRDVVVYCHRGGRSVRGAEILRAAGFARVRHLAGGIDAYAVRVAPDLRRY